MDGVKVIESMSNTWYPEGISFADKDDHESKALRSPMRNLRNANQQHFANSMKNLKIEKKP